MKKCKTNGLPFLRQLKSYIIIKIFWMQGGLCSIFGFFQKMNLNFFNPKRINILLIFRVHVEGSANFTGR